MFNSLIDTHHGEAETPQREVAIAHAKALCLVAVEAAQDEGTRQPDMELSTRAKHWSRVGLQLLKFHEPDEAELALNVSSRLLRYSYHGHPGHDSE